MYNGTVTLSSYQTVIFSASLPRRGSGHPRGTFRGEFTANGGPGSRQLSMTNSSRDSWEATTHRWTETVDGEHLRVARQRVGAVDGPQVVHMVLEVVAYADDEAADQQRTGRVLVELDADQISIADDGRGTDTRRDADGVAVRKPVMATQDLRFFGREDAPALPDGRARQGMSAVAASCRELVHENRRHDGAWSQAYEYGVPTSDLVELTHWNGTGTTVRLRQLDTLAVSGVDVAQLRSYLDGFRNVEVTVRPVVERGA